MEILSGTLDAIASDELAKMPFPQYRGRLNGFGKVEEAYKAESSIRMISIRADSRVIGFGLSQDMQPGMMFSILRDFPEIQADQYKQLARDVAAVLGTGAGILI